MQKKHSTRKGKTDLKYPYFLVISSLQFKLTKSEIKSSNNDYSTRLVFTLKKMRSWILARITNTLSCQWINIRKPCLKWVFGQSGIIFDSQISPKMLLNPSEGIFSFWWPLYLVGISRAVFLIWIQISLARFQRAERGQQQKLRLDIYCYLSKGIYCCTRRALSQFWSFNIRHPTFPNYIKFVDPRVLRL